MMIFRIKWSQVIISIAIIEVPLTIIYMIPLQYFDGILDITIGVVVYILIAVSLVVALVKNYYDKLYIIVSPDSLVYHIEARDKDISLEVLWYNIWSIRHKKGLLVINQIAINDHLVIPYRTFNDYRTLLQIIIEKSKNNENVYVDERLLSLLNGGHI